MRTRMIIAIAATALLGSAGAGATSQAATSSGAQPGQGCTAWQLVPTPSPLTGAGSSLFSGTATGGGLDSVSVISGSDAVFSGAANNRGFVALGAGGTPWVLAQHSGRFTQAAPIPAAIGSPVTTQGFGAAGISARTVISFDSTTDGWAFFGDDGGIEYPNGSIGERWHDARWTRAPLALVAPSPTTDYYQFPYVTAAASLSPASAWAVGHFGVNSASPRTPLIEHWDGTQWSTVPSPALQPDPALTALAVVSPDDIWAVGAQAVPETSYFGTPLAEHWDGTKWTIVPVPAGQGPATLTAVSAAGPDDVWAVGMQQLSSGTAPLVEHWDGSSWSVQQVPGIGGDGYGNYLSSVYAAGPDDVWAASEPAVADVSGARLGQPTVFLHWDGSTWATVPVPGPPEYGLVDGYTAISGSGPGDIWAAGTGYDFAADTATPLIAHLSCG
jgi:hypothetical protein